MVNAACWPGCNLLSVSWRDRRVGSSGFLVIAPVHVQRRPGWITAFPDAPTSEDKPHAITYPGPWWMVILVPAVGGLISGILVFTWAPEAEGHGTDAMVRAFHRGGGVIRSRVPAIKTIASIITIGTGGSAGQEGPIPQIGAGFGSWLARTLKLPPTDRRLLMLAGAAGGVGAIFRAPLGGALFAGEVLYSSTAFESAALLPCLASSIVAYSTFAMFITPKPIFNLPDMSFRGARVTLVHCVNTLVRRRRLALRACLLWAARSLFQAFADPKTPQAGFGRLITRHRGLEVSGSDGRWLWLGAMGCDRYATIADFSRGVELHTTYGSKRSPDARSPENRRHWPHH